MKIINVFTKIVFFIVLMTLFTNHSGGGNNTPVEVQPVDSLEYYRNGTILNVHIIRKHETNDTISPFNFLNINR